MTDETSTGIVGDAPFRLGLVEDHEVASLGFATLITQVPGFELVACAGSVAELPEGCWPLDLVVLDLRLQDGTTPAENVAAIRARGTEVLVLTSAEDAELVRSAARAGVLGIVRKSEPLDVIIDALRQAANGETAPTSEWAAALDADERLADAGLSAREREILALYASGEKAQAVAYRTGLSRATVTHYVSRIRSKYAKVGRNADTKIELNRRAREDGILS
ncbi:MAG TPA: response regulator transcription factor [Microbacteriaceae bacterium]